jgi:hypothetical protein
MSDLKPYTIDGQPSALPSRKVMAMVLTAAIVGGVRATLEAYGIEADGFVSVFQPALEALVIGAMGYVTSERAP